MVGNGLVIAVVLLLAVLDRSFVDPAALPVPHFGSPSATFAPVQTVETQQQDEEEAQLENLKKTAGTSLKVVESHSDRRIEDANHKERHTDARQQDGRLVAALERTVDSSPQQLGLARASLSVPALGVSQTVETPLPPQQRRSFPQDIDMLQQQQQHSGKQVTALDMAQYIFWTGDERGVSLAIQEFLHQGLMNREEAVTFLREIRQLMDALQVYYAQRRDEQQAAEQQALERASALQQALQNRLAKKSLLVGAPPPQVASPAPLFSEEEYAELLQRLREADALYTELALEELVYQLAKELFAQSLDRGRGEAQASLQRFSTLLRGEAEQGRIAHALESKLLDVLSASLMDALRERPLGNEEVVDKLSPQIIKPAGVKP